MNLFQFSLSSTEIQMNNKDNNDNKNGLSAIKNYKYHSKPSYTNCTSSGLTQQIKSLNLSSLTGNSSKIHYIEDDGYDDNNSIKKKSKIFHR